MDERLTPAGAEAIGAFCHARYLVDGVLVQHCGINGVLVYMRPRNVRDSIIYSKTEKGKYK